MLFRDDLYDDFESGVYTLKDGQVSPNKKWANIYNGGGSSGVRNELDTSNNVFFMYPNIAKALTKHLQIWSQLLVTSLTLI